MGQIMLINLPLREITVLVTVETDVYGRNVPPRCACSARVTRRVVLVPNSWLSHRHSIELVLLITILLIDTIREHIMVGALGLGNQLRTCAIRQASRRQHRRWSSINPTVLNAQGYQKEIIKEGSGPTPTQGQKVSWGRGTGTLEGGREKELFDGVVSFRKPTGQTGLTIFMAIY